MIPETINPSAAIKTDITQLKWVILGGGEIGTAIATALCSAGAARELVLIQRNPDKRKSLTASGFETRATLTGLTEVDILIVAVKPHDVQTALRQARPYLSSQTWVISVAAGVTYQCLSSWVPPGQPVFRIRPSVFIRQPCGNWLLAPNPNGYDREFERLVAFLHTTGHVFVLPEDLMEQSTWESSSIPAIVVPKILQLFVQAAPEAYRASVANMMRAGLASLLTYLKEQEAVGISPSQALNELSRTVVTAGGINDAAIQYLEQVDFWQTLHQAKRTYTEAEENLKRRLS